MKIKPVKAWAVVDEDRPEINVLDITATKMWYLNQERRLLA